MANTEIDGWADVLMTAYILEDTLDAHVVSRPIVQADAEVLALAARIHVQLLDLYRLVRDRLADDAA